MIVRIIRFPREIIRRDSQARIGSALAQDPNYRFVRDLLSAMAGIGLELDKPPEAKARELYARYQHEKGLIHCPGEVE